MWIVVVSCCSFGKELVFQLSWNLKSKLTYFANFMSLCKVTMSFTTEENAKTFKVSAFSN